MENITENKVKMTIMKGLILLHHIKEYTKLMGNFNTSNDTNGISYFG